MVLSDNGDHPMTRLSDTQLVILSGAAQRDDGAVLPLPETLKIKGGALDKVLGSLKAKGLIDHLGAPRGDDPPPLRITCAGLQAIGVEPKYENETPAPEADPGATPADSGVQALSTPAPATKASGAATPPKGKAAKAGKAAPATGKGKKTSTTARAASEAAPGSEPGAQSAPRAGTKQALLIELLKRPEGATVEQIAQATGWQRHTVRGAISGALKKKLGLTVEATRIREVGPNKSGAKGSATVYRITGSSPRTS
jgi:Protein of unknown function (DUF3489)